MDPMAGVTREHDDAGRETNDQIARKAEAAAEGMSMRERVRLARILSRVFVWDREREEWV